MLIGQIYQITNKVTGDTYVGLTRKSVQARWKEHTYKAHEKNPKYWLHRAIAKYGDQSFFVEAVASSLTIEALLIAEQEIIRDRRPTYNQTNGGEATIGRSCTEEVKEKIRRSNTGRRRSREYRENMSQVKKQQYADDRALREAATIRILEARKLVDESKRLAAARKARAGIPMPKEAIEKIRFAAMGRVHTQKTKAKISRAKQKPVICLNNNICYETAKHAAESIGISHTSVLRVLKNRYPEVKGYKFVYKGQ